MIKITIFILFFHINFAISQDSIKDHFLAPFEEEAKPYLYYGVGITAGLLILEDQIIDPIQEDTVEDKPLGSFSKAGDLAGQLIPNLLYMGYNYTNSWINKNSEAQSNANLMFKATLYASATTTILKYIVREPRPNSVDRHSFPSGHTTTAFAFASVVGMRHSFYWGLAAYTLAGFVAYSRINDNYHYIHDVMAGATIGISYGIGLHYLDKKKKKTTYHLLPQVDRDKIGLMFVKNF